VNFRARAKIFKATLLDTSERCATRDCGLYYLSAADRRKEKERKKEEEKHGGEGGMTLATRAQPRGSIKLSVSTKQLREYYSPALYYTQPSCYVEWLKLWHAGRVVYTKFVEHVLPLCF